MTSSALTISTTVSHRVRTVTLRDDLVGWVVSGHKRLVTPRGSVGFAPGDMFVIARGTQWDMVNDAAPGGRYEARMINCAPTLLERFHARFGQFAATPPVQGCTSLPADGALLATFAHAMTAFADSEMSDAVREHRALELLLMLAERGRVLAPASELGWADRARRLVAQRPHAAWSVEDLAKAFHLSSSTLQRRLSEEGTSVRDCVREVRLETAMALLQSTSLQVLEVAGRCGYDSHSRFSAAFKERFGFAPSHLRA